MVRCPRLSSAVASAELQLQTIPELRVFHLIGCQEDQYMLECPTGCRTLSLIAVWFAANSAAIILSVLYAGFLQTYCPEWLPFVFAVESVSN